MIHQNCQEKHICHTNIVMFSFWEYESNLAATHRWTSFAVKVVICGKNKHWNKTIFARISLQILFSLKLKIEGHTV